MDIQQSFFFLIAEPLVLLSILMILVYQFWQRQKASHVLENFGENEHILDDTWFEKKKEYPTFNYSQQIIYLIIAGLYGFFIGFGEVYYRPNFEGIELFNLKTDPLLALFGLAFLQILFVKDYKSKRNNHIYFFLQSILLWGSFVLGWRIGATFFNAQFFNDLISSAIIATLISIVTGIILRKTKS